MAQINVVHICSNYNSFENILNVGVARKDMNENGANKKLENGSGSCKRQFTDEMAVNKNTNVQSKRQHRNKDSNNRKT